MNDKLNSEYDEMRAIKYNEIAEPGKY